ncbi:MAG: hypothetical protein J0H31_09810, partial [Alphaproteobacteria bacterium]|nr:hypothetical protein [Alphaproteobacteria bacterium]
ETSPRLATPPLKRKDHIDAHRQPRPQIFERPQSLETNSGRQIRGAKNKKQMDWMESQQRSLTASR